MNSYCSFCASSGVKGPHDHFLRVSKEPDSKVVCPKLLATKCNFCGKMGHTARFCGEKQDRENQRRAELSAKKQKAFEAGDWMDVGQGHVKPEVQSPRVSRGNTVCPGAPKPSTRFVSMFAALDIESESSGDESCGECHENEPEVVEPTGQSWASIVKNPRAPAKLEEEEDEALPPLIFGKRFNTRWGDDD